MVNAPEGLNKVILRKVKRFLVNTCKLGLQHNFLYYIINFLYYIYILYSIFSEDIHFLKKFIFWQKTFIFCQKVKFWRAFYEMIFVEYQMKNYF